MPPSAPNFLPPAPTPLNGQTAYNCYNAWGLQHAGYYPGYYPAYNAGYAPVVPASYVPSYWYGQ